MQHPVHLVVVVVDGEQLERLADQAHGGRVQFFAREIRQQDLDKNIGAAITVSEFNQAHTGLNDMVVDCWLN